MQHRNVCDRKTPQPTCDRGLRHRFVAALKLAPGSRHGRSCEKPPDPHVSIKVNKAARTTRLDGLPKSDSRRAA